jgi:hypothetical protein
MSRTAGKTCWWSPIQHGLNHQVSYWRPRECKVTISSDHRISRGHQTRPRVRFVKINQKSFARHGAGVGADPGGETDSGPLRIPPCSVNRAHHLWTIWVSRRKIEFVRSTLADRASVEYFHQDRNYLYSQTRSKCKHHILLAKVLAGVLSPARTAHMVIRGVQHAGCLPTQSSACRHSTCSI